MRNPFKRRPLIIKGFDGPDAYRPLLFGSKGIADQIDIIYIGYVWCVRSRRLRKRVFKEVGGNLCCVIYKEKRKR